MSDAVTSSATAAGDTGSLLSQEERVKILFESPPVTGNLMDAGHEQALSEVADYPTIGAVAVVEMARADAGWTARMGDKNGLKKYEAFAAGLRNSGWFNEVRQSATVPAFELSKPISSVKAITQAAYPNLDVSEQLAVARALIRSLSYALGPDGVATQPAAPENAPLGKPEVLERRVTTIASHVLSAGQAPRFDMHWATEVFLRTKDGKDDPKEKTDRHVSDHHFVFNIDRWKSGDRSALNEYYRRMEEWLEDFNTTGGRQKSMACFDPMF